MLDEYLGISAKAVSRWESVNFYPDIETLPRLAEFFGVNTDVLLCISCTCAGFETNLGTIKHCYSFRRNDYRFLQSVQSLYGYH